MLAQNITLLSQLARRVCYAIQMVHFKGKLQALNGRMQFIAVIKFKWSVSGTLFSLGEQSSALPHLGRELPSPAVVSKQSSKFPGAFLQGGSKLLQVLDQLILGWAGEPSSPSVIIMKPFVARGRHNDLIIITSSHYLSGNVCGIWFGQCLSGLTLVSTGVLLWFPKRRCIGT